MVNKSDKIKKWIFKHSVLCAFIFIALLLLIADIAIGGNTKFYAKWAACGQKPVALESEIMNPIIFYKEPSSFEVFRLGTTYFCTPLEAERAGYSANSKQYQFPHLDAERAKEKK